MKVLITGGAGFIGSNLVETQKKFWAMRRILTLNEHWKARWLFTGFKCPLPSKE